MLEFRIDSTPLLMFPGTDAGMELASTLLASGLEDAFTLPITVPREGNEVVLGFVNEFDLRRRTVKFENAECWYGGSRKHKGTLFVEAADERTVSLSFSVDGLIATIGDTKLGDLDMGELIVVDDIRDHAAEVNTEQWPARPYCFPMILAPDLFSSSENPAWAPSTEEWNDTDAYATNDFVTYTSGTPVRRTWTYQCIADTSPGESPDTAPAKWRRTAFGILNHWNHEDEEFFANTSDGNFYALCPMFFTKEILRRALSAYGYGVGGQWWDDDRYHQLWLWNNRTLDANTREYYFRAAQSTPVTESSGFILPVEFDDESNAPNEDSTGVWNNSTYRFIPLAAGTYFITIHAEISAPITDNLLVEMHRVSDFQPVGERTWFSASSVNDTFSFTFEVAPGDVGEEYRVGVIALESFGTGTNPVTISNFWIRGWRTEAGVLNSFSNEIDPAGHMPDVSLKDLLIDLRDLYGLRIWLDKNTNRLLLDYMQPMVTAGRPTDATSLLRAPVTLETAGRIGGFRFAWDIDQPDLPDLSRLVLHGTYRTESELTAPNTPLDYAIVLNSRRIYLPRINEAGTSFDWYPSGWYLPSVLIGEEDDVTTITPGLAPFFMEWISVLGELFLVPYIDDRGNSGFFRTGDNKPALRMAFWRGMTSNYEGPGTPAGITPTYPFGTSFGYTTFDEIIDADEELEWGSETGPVELHHRAMCAALVGAERYTTDIEPDVSMTVGRGYEPGIMLHNQKCFILTLPISYTDDHRPLISRGMRFIKLLTS